MNLANVHLIQNAKQVVSFLGSAKSSLTQIEKPLHPITNPFGSIQALKLVSKYRTDYKKSRQTNRVSQNPENSDFRRSIQVTPASILSRSTFLYCPNAFRPSRWQIDFSLSSEIISLGPNWSNNIFITSSKSSKNVHLHECCKNFKKCYHFKIFCFKLTFHSAFFPLKSTILSHSHFISIEAVDFPTVSPTVRQQTWTKMVQFHWSQHLLSNVVQVSFKHSRAFFIMPDGLAIKTFTFGNPSPSSMLLVYMFEFECTIQKPLQIFSKNKTDCLCSNKLSNCINCPLACTCFSKYYVKKRGKEKRKKKFFHRRNCSLITNRTP